MCYRSKVDSVEITDCSLFSCLTKSYTFQLINKIDITLLTAVCIGGQVKLYFMKGFTYIKVNCKTH